MAATGLQSPSGALTITGIVAVALSAVEGILTPGTSVHTAVYGGGGLIVGLVSVIGKLVHDKGIHVATIQQAGSDIAADVPELKLNLDKVLSFAESDFPGLKDRIDALEVKASSIVAPLAPDATAIETVVRQVLAGIAPAPAPTPPVA